MNTPRKSKCDRTPTLSKCDRTPTPRTDEFVAEHDFRPAPYHCLNLAAKLETELTAITEQRDRLAEAIRLTLMENLDLCDGDKCTLKRLKDAIGFDLDSEENSQADRPQGSV